MTRTHEWAKGEVFVFGSNLRGVHGGGAAKFAYEHCGAHWGRASGFSGSSYAIPTCAAPGLALGLAEIDRYARTFIVFAQARPELQFFLTRVGCGIAGYKDSEIAPLFAGLPSNVRTPPEWDGLF